MECLFCHTILEHKILDLGHSPLANAYLSHEGLQGPETSYPLKAYVCHHCFLVQLYGRANPADIFNESYAYISSSSSTWQQHCRDYTDQIIGLLPPNDNKLVVELGCNDGMLLQEFIKKGVRVIGIDPAITATAIATSKGVPVITGFFTKQLAKTLAENNKKADLIIGNNVIAHVPGINDFVGGIAQLLKDDGFCTLEFPYLPNLFSCNEFDTIYHEHFFYFSLTAMDTILARHGLQLFNVEKLKTHGGSLRVYLQLQTTGKKQVNESINELLQQETASGITDLGFYKGLQEKALTIKTGFLTWLMKVLNEGGKIMAYGAAAKGNTFLNYCGVHSDLVPCIADVTIQKQGKFLPGSHIPIVSESAINEIKPDYIIVLPWNFKEEINHRLEFVKAWGGKLVYFIPGFDIV